MPTESHLAMQVGRYFFSFCICDAEKRRLLQLKRYRFSALSLRHLDSIFNENAVLNGHFQSITTALDFGFSSLLPASLHVSETAPLMYLENADQQDHVITEPVPGHDASNRYTVPPDILTWIVHHFPSSSYYHTHTIQIAAAATAGENGLIRVDFSDNVFTVAVFKNENLLLAKTFRYSTSTDAVFYLLKICEVFGLKQESVSVEISGLVDASSKLYREVYDYFLNTSFKAADWLDDNSEVPSHYFTALNELVLCESFQEV